MFDVKFGEDPSDVTVQLRLAIVQPDTRGESVPGEWIEDREQAYCDASWLYLRERDVEATSYAVQRGEWSDDDELDFLSHYHEPVEEIEMGDGRRADVYVLSEYSTKGFKDGDYELENTVTFDRDLDKFPLRVEYEDGRIMLVDD